MAGQGDYTGRIAFLCRPMRMLGCLKAVGVFALAAVFCTRVAFAQASQAPLTLIVGYAPGGSVDFIARLIAEPLHKSLGRPVIVENRPGAAGIVAAVELKRAPKDGSVLLVAPLVIPVLAPLTYRELPYDASRDIAPVTQILRLQQAFAVPAAHPAKSVAEYVAWAKVHAKQASFGSSTPGGLPHFLGLLIGKEAGIDLVFVPYKGAAAMLNDLSGDHISAGVDSLADLLPLHRAGRIRILATSGRTRSPLAPQVPTLAEQGFPTIDAVSWIGVFAPGGTPIEVRNHVARAIVAAVQGPEMSALLEAKGFEPTGTTPAETAAIIAADRARWEPIVKASGFRAD